MATDRTKKRKESSESFRAHGSLKTSFPSHDIQNYDSTYHPNAPRTWSIYLSLVCSVWVWWQWVCVRICICGAMCGCRCSSGGQKPELSFLMLPPPAIRRVSHLTPELADEAKLPSFPRGPHFCSAHTRVTNKWGIWGLILMISLQVFNVPAESSAQHQS